MLKKSQYFCAAALWLMMIGQSAARDLSQDEALKLRRNGEILSSHIFIERALARHPKARLLELELEKKHDLYIYEIELLTVQGQVRELKFNASTGELLKDEEDD